MQKTLKSKASFIGVGLHSGVSARATVKPASAEFGIWFRRTDVADKDAYICASWQFVEQTPLCTRLVNAEGVSVSTIEHLMAALAGCGVTNALIEVDGPEVPILDGSSQEFVETLLSVGTTKQDVPARAIRILKPIEVRRGDAVARFEPSETFEMDFEIDFDDVAIGRQRKSMHMANGAFVHELSNSRTFCRNSDVDFMRSQGLALGGTMENAIVFDGADILSPGGLRHVDEPVRHKMLDALGDLSLSGGSIIGKYVGYKAGHSLTNELLRQLFADPTSFEMIDCCGDLADEMPGADVTHKDVVHLPV